jgi:MFS family permease
MRTPAIWFLTYAASNSVWTFIPILAKEELGIGNAPIGVAVILYSVALFASSYVFGRASDVHGRRNYILGGLLVASLAMAAHYLISDAPSLWLVRLATGCALGVYPAALLDYIARKQGRLGRFSSWGSLGWGVGALGAGYLATVYGDISWVFILSAGIYLIALAMALTLRPVEEVRHRVPFFPKSLIKRNLHIYVPMLVRHSGAMSIWTFWPLFLRDLGASYVWVGIIQFVNPLVQFAFMYGLTDRVRTSLLFPVGLVVSAVTFLSFTFAPDVLWLVPTQVLLGISWGSAYVGALRTVTETAEEKATSVGLLNSTTSLSAIIGPVIATGLVGISADYTVPMYLAAGLSVVALVLHYALRGWLRNNGELIASA